MGRSRRYRQRIQMQSVHTKGILHHLVQILHAEVLAARSTQWLRFLGDSTALQHSLCLGVTFRTPEPEERLVILHYNGRIGCQARSFYAAGMPGVNP